MSHQKKIWAVKHSKKAISRQTSILLLRNGQTICYVSNVDRNYLIIWQLCLFLTKKMVKYKLWQCILLEKGDPDKSIFTYAYNYVDICYYTKSKRALYKKGFLSSKFLILLPLINTVYVLKVWKVCIIQYLISVKCVHLCVRKPLKCISK